MRKAVKKMKSESAARKAREILAVAVAVLMLSALALFGCSSNASSPSASNEGNSSNGATEPSTAGEQVSPSEEAAMSGDDITVAVALKEAVTKATDVDTPLQFAEETINVQAAKGTSALDLLKGTGREIDVQGEGAAAEVIGIGGLENGDAGDTSHWVYALNGTEQSVSPAECFPNNGDTLTWTFVKE